ncbi:MAG: hypothetical protein KI785_09595 [Devosiaceae bacterium]|nr:hypothetical protein [Devosiaceae bacterium MH13]
MSVSVLTTERLAAANINPTSYLATDYLNHFNEVLMLMEMVPDVPDMAADVLEWEPRGYAEHFEQSVFTEKALAIEAYAKAPRDTLERFGAVIAELDAGIGDAQILLAGVDPTSRMDPALADRLTTTIVDHLRPAIDRASAIINATDAGQAALPEDDETAKMRAQDAIDQLFD